MRRNYPAKEPRSPPEPSTETTLPGGQLLYQTTYEPLHNSAHGGLPLYIKDTPDVVRSELMIPSQGLLTAGSRESSDTTHSTPYNPRVSHVVGQTSRETTLDNLSRLSPPQASPKNQVDSHRWQSRIDSVLTSDSNLRKDLAILGTADSSNEAQRVTDPSREQGQTQGYPSTKLKDRGQFFANAHHLVFKDSSMIGVQQVNIQDNSYDTVMWWLEEHATPGAEYDSSARDPPPRCHPGTRTGITQRINKWLGTHKPHKKLLWLRGPAGVGKSAIIQTLAESLSETQQRLGASFFFSRPNGRNKPLEVLPTLAYRFAVQDPQYKSYIQQLMLADPGSLRKAMSEQFRTLIIEPFVHRKIRSGLGAWVVTLDGLDECGGDCAEAGRHSDRIQCELVRLISDFLLQYPSVPLLWIIASRPETHLKAVFLEENVVPIFWEEDIPVDSDEACRDVEKFLHKEFTKIRQNYPDHIREDSIWPSSNQLLKIANAALGLFVFAQVIIRFVDDPRVGNPIAQLNCVVSVISKLPLSPGREGNPLASLDLIYLEILSKIPPDVLQLTKQLLGSLIFFQLRNIGVSVCDFRQTCTYFGITRDSAITALRYLHSVLYFPKCEDIGQTRPRFYHASFQDFLQDSSRSFGYFIDVRFIAAELLGGIIRTAEVQLSSNPTPLSWPDEEEFADRPGAFVSETLCRIFRGDISSTGVHFAFYGAGYFLSDHLFQQLLDNLSVIKIVEYVPTLIIHLLDGQWPSEPKEDTLRELGIRGFLSWTTFESLHINWDTISSISYISLRYDHIHLSKTDPKPNDFEISERQALQMLELRRCLQLAPQTEVIILGHRLSEYCAIIKKEALWYIWEADVPVVNYIITGISLR